LSGAGQGTISIEEATARSDADFAPTMDGRTVAVRGQVSSHPINVFGYTHLAIQDKDQGIILEGRPETFAELTPGDWIEARGRIVNRNGLAALVVSKVVIESAGARPLPKPAPAGDLLTFRYLGQLVSTEDRVLEIGENAEGVFLRMGEVEAPLKVFMPQPQGATRKRFDDISIGDKVRVTGVSYQYCPSPPYDRYFEILVDRPQAIEIINQNWVMEVWALRPLVMFLVVGAAVWYWRERRAKEQREILRRMYTLSEEILDSSSPADILSRIEAVLPKVLRITSVRLYLYDRGTRTLVPVSPSDQRTDPSVPLDGPSGFFESGLVNAFVHRIMVTIGDTKRSQFGLPGRDKTNMLMPRSLVYVPMLTQGESVGVLQMENSRQARNFTDDEKASAQHLANQVGLAFKLLQQRSFREQLARSEKLAAVGRLISGVVNDLQTPLAAITGMAESSLEKDPGSADSHELLVIASEAKRASAIVSRLVSFAQPEHVRPEPVDLIGLLRGLIRFREREWKACGIHLRNMLKDQKLYVLASQGQIEQVFLNLLVHAEQVLEEVADKRMQVRADVLAKRIFIEIRYSAPAPRQSGQDEIQSLEMEVNSLGLDVCRTIITGHGGEMRLARPSEKEACFEIELPSMPVEKPVEQAAAVETREFSRRLTAMLIEPEEWVERQLMEALGARGYRVVPVHSSEEALDLIGRMRFDVVFCSTQLEGLNWVEFYDRVRGRVGAFTLLAEIFSHDLSMHFQGEGRYLVLKPIEKAQFERTLEAVESRIAAQSTDNRTPELESYS
jgi:signal transduction histidine kinase